MKTQEQNKILPADGYIKFQCKHTHAVWNSEALPVTAAFMARFEEADAFRTEVFDQGFIGIYENGIGYGNLSFRYGENFVITASATGGARELGIDGYTLVNKVELSKNTVHCLGPLPASSETMSHAGVYLESPLANYVLHIHNNLLFNILKEKNALSTSENIAYGTVEMAKAIRTIVKRNLSEAIIVMHGHEEGILIYGMSLAHLKSQLVFLCQEAKNELCAQCKKGGHNG